MDRPITTWREKDSINGHPVDSMVVILDGPGCRYAAHGGCTMCGYNSGKKKAKDRTDLAEQVDHVLNGLSSTPYLKVFTSGSFLDGDEIPTEVVIKLLEGVSDLSPGTRVLIESRPEFVTQGTIDLIKRSHRNIEIAIGLETSSDRVRWEYVQKGFTWEQFCQAGRAIVENGLLLKTYLLMKPPFLGEYDAYMDMMASIRDLVKEFPSSRISINPMNIQSGTPLEALFNGGHYRPPWLRTLFKTLVDAKMIVPDGTHIMSCPTAGGKRRGAHNCGECDELFLSVIESFSLDNSFPLHLPDMDCCSREWERAMRASTIHPLGVVP
jgi:radical SAM enzyme (TIGR01210 family)